MLNKLLAASVLCILCSFVEMKCPTVKTCVPGWAKFGPWCVGALSMTASYSGAKAACERHSAKLLSTDLWGTSDLDDLQVYLENLQDALNSSMYYFWGPKSTSTYFSSSSLSRTSFTLNGKKIYCNDPRFCRGSCHNNATMPQLFFKVKLGTRCLINSDPNGGFSDAVVCQYKA